MSFAGITRGSNISDATVDQKDGRNEAGDADGPVDHLFDESVGLDTSVSNTVSKIASSSDENGSDGADDEMGRYNNGKTNKSISKGFFATYDFVGVATGKGVKITSVDDVAKDEISGNNSDITGDISNDDPDAGF